MKTDTESWIPNPDERGATQRRSQLGAKNQTRKKAKNQERSKGRETDDACICGSVWDLVYVYVSAYVRVVICLCRAGWVPKAVRKAGHSGMLGCWMLRCRISGWLMGRTEVWGRLAVVE